MGANFYDLNYFNTKLGMLELGIRQKAFLHIVYQ